MYLHSLHSCLIQACNDWEGLRCVLQTFESMMQYMGTHSTTQTVIGSHFDQVDVKGLLCKCSCVFVNPVYKMKPSVPVNAHF